MVFVYIIILIAGASVYTVCAVIVIASLHRVRTGTNPEKPFVSVIVATHNDRDTIENCLASLFKQDYGHDTFEVIVADDRSSDGTSGVIASFQSQQKNLSIVRIDDVPANISPKKHALLSAIHKARGDIILQTDGDCVVPPSWISGMVRGCEKGVGIVAGIAPYWKEKGMLNSFIRHEYLWNAAVMASSITMGQGVHASGRNLAYRRDIFLNSGGYGSMNEVLSGDDTLLLQRIQNLSNTHAAIMPDPSTHVYTASPKDFRAFLRQRIRHMSTGKYFDPLYIALGSAVYGFYILLLLTSVLSFISQEALIWFIGVFLWKTVLDGITAITTGKVLGLDVQWKKFMLNEFFLMLYMAIMPLLGLFMPVRWKENS